MYYALVSSIDEDCGDGCHRLFFGTLDEIASSIIRHCSDGLPWDEIEDGTMDDLEDAYACDFDSYHALADSNHPSEEDIRNFYFYFSGSVVRVIALTDSYADLADAFNAYAEDSSLCEWRMRPGNITDPSVLAKVDMDLANLSVSSSPYFERIEE